MFLNFFRSAFLNGTFLRENEAVPKKEIIYRSPGLQTAAARMPSLLLLEQYGIRVNIPSVRRTLYVEPRTADSIACVKMAGLVLEPESTLPP